MAAKIFSLLILLALFASAATATFTSQCSQPPIAAPLLPLPPVCGNPILQPYRLQEEIVVQSIRAQQLQQLVLPAISQVNVANLAAYSQQQQLLPLNPLAAVNPAAFLQQQPLLPFSQVAAASPSAFWPQQQLAPFYPQGVANVATLFQLQQLLQFIQIGLRNPIASCQQQPIIGGPLYRKIA